MDSYKNYEFKTNESFYGMPQFSSSISYALNVIKFIKPT